MTARGYSLIECLVAMVILGLISSAVAQTVIVAQRARQLSENWMRATEFATERIEAVRAGIVIDDQPVSGIFQRDTMTTTVAAHPGLKQLDVTVTWADSQPRRLTLSTMVQR